ncbi:type IX secretion system motor protein PorM/GldM [Flavobacterium sp. HNIBRBA15423]|uniref:type IX secretion system motor protein PorM/GldM n=1 Tax=Flavobacterium sp. HNIBRBA15423 TaxID=3458683 RepID=UPI004043B45C
MAGGKLTPRQKMINLMYLVFIAMLALNMSKEVLSAFGLMTEKFTVSNEDAKNRIELDMKGMEKQMESQPEKFAPLVKQANQVQTLSNEFFSYIEGLKKEMLATVENPKDYEVQDKPDFLDEKFFIGDKLKPEGQKFLDQMKKYREGVANALGAEKKYTEVVKSVNSSFSTEPVANRDGIKVNWMDYHYKGYPMVASVTKLTALQADIRKTQADVLNAMVQEKLKVEASLTNFDAIVIPDKTAFFSGEQFKGKIILGKKDKTLKANAVVVNGKELPATAMQEGQTILEFPAGNVGEQKISGKMSFTDFDGNSFDLPIESTYTVVPKPNSATISADKMNVVYRGVVNPMTISFAGVSDNNVNASAAGLSKASGTGKYNMSPGKGREVTINVTGKLPDGTSVSDKKEFRIKDIPGPQGRVRGEVAAKGPKNSLEVSTVSAVLEDFDFELGIDVTGFNIKVPGQPTIVVSGSRMDGRAKAAIGKASRGDVIIISEIKTKLRGSDIYMKKTAPCTYEIQ